MKVHRIEPQIQEVKTRQGGDGSKGIVVHQTVAGQVKLPEVEKKMRQTSTKRICCYYLMQGSFCIPSNCSSLLYERARVVRGASGCITGGLFS